MEETAKNWYVVYTKPRWEKKTNGILLRKGIESWCPVQKLERQWSDRKKIIEDPVFKSYLFVHVVHDQKPQVLQTDGILNFVYYLGKPAIVRDDEIATIKSFLLEKDVQITLRALEAFKENDKVIIRQGVFMDNTGTVIKTGSRKIYVRLESLGQVMVVEFPANFISHHFPAMPGR